MNIAMFTNTYLPHVGGVARSVNAFASEFRRQGHQVLIVAPEFEHMDVNESDVVRVPAIQHFNMSDFSVALPVSGLLSGPLDHFQPEIIHAHHPYILGMTALRIARFRQIPIVFTHHTLYEKYTHYVPGDSALLQNFVIELATQFANLVDAVFAPSRSIGELLKNRGVMVPIHEIPTGVDIGRFAQGNGSKVRRRLGIDEKHFVVGHLGRLAPEKNLQFLSQCIIRFMQQNQNSHFILVGNGPMESIIRKRFDAAGLSRRLHVEGVLVDCDLSDTLHAMDVFAFSSKSETQGMVLTEAMAAGLPVVALDATGAREVVRDEFNGRLLCEEEVGIFTDALEWIKTRSPQERAMLRKNALSTAHSFSMPNTASKALQAYASVLDQTKQRAVFDGDIPQLFKLMRLIKTEWELLKGYAESGSRAMHRESPQ